MSKRLHIALSVFLLFSLLLAPLAEARASRFFQPQAASTDFGDAPDSTNSAGQAMTAYPDVSADFPTSVGAAEPYGPRHANETLRFYLGAAVSGEDGADGGFDSDLDGDNNLTPPGIANRDGSDDGLLLPASFKHCAQTTLRYQVNVLTSPAAAVYFNLWVDWDRSGAWGDAAALACGGEVVSEWAVQNQALTPDQTGLLVVETPAFLAYAPDLSSLWLRATLSEQPAPAGDGSAPAAGYQDGETEDYLFQSQRIAYLPAMFDGTAGPDPEPVEGEPQPEFADLGALALRWAQLDGVSVSGTVQAPANGLQLVVEEPEPGSAEGIKFSHFDLSAIANGTRYRGAQPADPTGGSQISVPFSTTISLISLGIDAANLRSPGHLDVTLVYTGADGQLARAAAPSLGFHGDEGDPDGVVIYGPRGEQRQASALQYDHNAAMNQRLASLIAPDEPITMTSGIDVFQDGDPILEERPADFNEDDVLEPPELIGDPIPQQPGEAPSASYTICLQMEVATVDSGFGEDYGLVNSNWKARGARVVIRHDGKKIGDFYLNRDGCGTFSSNKSGNISVDFRGEMRIRNAAGDRYITLMNMPADSLDGSFTVLTRKMTIYNPVPGKTYYPVVVGRDALAILAYAMQERVFLSSLHKKNIWVKFIGCRNDANKGSCSGSSVGKRFLWLSSINNENRRKFAILHEYGHAMLHEAGDYINQDCSFGTGDKSFHGMTGLEYSSCAAGEGWAHFIAAISWNDPYEGSNPTGFFRYWSGSTYNLENGPDNALCGAQPSNNCNSYGIEIDWMRQYWDFYTNTGSRPTLQGMINLLDNVKWRDGERDTSGMIEAGASSAARTRWHDLGCYNSVTESNCP